MVTLTASVPQRESLLPPPRRLVVLAVAVLIAPGILLHEGLSEQTRDAVVIAAFSGVLFLLVILRPTGMVVAHRRTVRRELALHVAAASLVSAFRQGEVAQSCRTAVDRLMGPDAPHRTLMQPSERAADLGARGTHLVSPAALAPGVAAELDDLPTVLVCPMPQPDRTPGTVPGVLLVAAPERQLTERFRGPTPWTCGRRASTWRSPPVRSCPVTGWASASSSRRSTPTTTSTA
ncbi:hypothetical protein [Streptomyces coeruleorubidus]|uniref:hypothetical protein n=1 Tax=Streptomyces coeruleorubidus TaxID=116188 RepID=UPI00368E9F5E